MVEPEGRVTRNRLLPSPASIPFPTTFSRSSVTAAGDRTRTPKCCWRECEMAARRGQHVRVQVSGAGSSNSFDVRQVLLIGPVCAGKSTLLPLVADGLGTSGIDLDDVAETYYDEVGYGRTRLDEVGAELGDLGAYRWWQRGHPHAVRRVLEDHPRAVIALGAGHTVFLDPDLQQEVGELLRPHRVVLLLPSVDLEESVRIVRQRALDTRGMSWIMNDHDVIGEWVNGPQNAELADLTVFADGRGPAEVAAEVLERLAAS